MYGVLEAELFHPTKHKYPSYLVIGAKVLHLGLAYSSFDSARKNPPNFPAVQARSMMLRAMIRADIIGTNLWTSPSRS